MLKWPKRAARAVAKLFEPLQDVDVFVEDVNDEVFYTQLLQRAVGSRRRIRRVIPVGNRTAVIEEARRHTGSRTAVYIIDGDFEWVLGLPQPDVPRLFRLNAYCVENLLVEGSAAARILFEELQISESEATDRLSFEEWLNEIEGPLVELFSVFAAAHHNGVGVATASEGPGCVCCSLPGGLPVFDAQKARELKAAIVAASDVAGVRERFDITVSEVLSRCDRLRRKCDIVSGKNFLLPLLDFRLRQLGCKVNRRTLRFRLALHSDLARLSELGAALERL